MVSLLTRIILLAVLIAVNSPCKFIQSPMDLGSLNFLPTTNKASLDYGRIVFNSPSAVLRPQSPGDISLLLSTLSITAGTVTVAARGAGHSISGQAQAPDGIVVEMDSLPDFIKVHRKAADDKDGFAYADVSGGVLWIQLLDVSLREGLAPRSWTDYLYLSIGGTLSNAGISGQTFKYGPQISNVLQLDVVTGTGELVTCSATTRPELFHAVLGGLGQFGIITRARILLQDAPQKVKWVRAFYDDFDAFTSDQELLVSMPDDVDYVEGFMVLNEQSILGTSIAFPPYMDFVQVLRSENPARVYYCIEFAVHVDSNDNTNQAVKNILELLSYMPPYIYTAEVSYYDFLNRVRLEEVNLRGRGLWDVPHPWLNMFVPKSSISRFKDLLLETISPQHFQGPILIYPILKDKWSTNTSVVLPDTSDNVLYIVGMLRSADPAACSDQCLREHLLRNRRLADAAGAATGAKQYLAGHREQRAWRDHFGEAKWWRFAANKHRFDPLHILSPGQNIFQRRQQQHGAAHRHYGYSLQ